MELAKFQTFLSDNDVYRQNQKFWSDTFRSLSQDAFEDWVVTTFANGEDFYDGNPIFSAFYPAKNKAIRIVQIERDSFVPELRIWQENVRQETALIKELLLVVQPTDTAFQSVRAISSAFLQSVPIAKHIHSYNTFYKSKASQARAKSAISSFEKAKFLYR